MLVYGKGQFFLPHQDSEKDDAMVGTLVVSLPSAHTGGELVVDHAGQSVTYRALEGGADLRRVLRRLPSPGHAGEVRVPGDAHVQPALRQRGAARREPGPSPSWRTA